MMITFAYIYIHVYIRIRENLWIPTCTMTKRKKQNGTILRNKTSTICMIETWLYIRKLKRSFFFLLLYFPSMTCKTWGNSRMLIMYFLPSLIHWKSTVSRYVKDISSIIDMIIIIRQWEPDWSNVHRIYIEYADVYIREILKEKKSRKIRRKSDNKEKGYYVFFFQIHFY